MCIRDRTTTDLTSAPETSSWLSRVGDLVSDLTRSRRPQELDDSHPLSVAVAAAASKLGRDAPRIVVVDSGRPVTYVPKSDTLRVHLAHAAVGMLLDRGEVELLAATALGEINRMLEVVTDAEEARSIISLVEQRARRAAR